MPRITSKGFDILKPDGTHYEFRLVVHYTVKRGCFYASLPGHFQVFFGQKDVEGNSPQDCFDVFVRLKGKFRRALTNFEKVIGVIYHFDEMNFFAKCPTIGLRYVIAYARRLGDYGDIHYTYRSEIDLPGAAVTLSHHNVNNADKYTWIGWTEEREAAIKALHDNFLMLAERMSEYLGSGDVKLASLLDDSVPMLPTSTTTETEQGG